MATNFQVLFGFLKIPFRSCFCSLLLALYRCLSCQFFYQYLYQFSYQSSYQLSFRVPYGSRDRSLLKQLSAYFYQLINNLRHRSSHFHCAIARQSLICLSLLLFRSFWLLFALVSLFAGAFLLVLLLVLLLALFHSLILFC